MHLRNSFFPEAEQLPLPRSLPYPAELYPLLATLVPGRPALPACLRGRYTAEALAAVRAALVTALAAAEPADVCAAVGRQATAGSV